MMEAMVLNCAAHENCQPVSPRLKCNRFTKKRMMRSSTKTTIRTPRKARKPYPEQTERRTDAIRLTGIRDRFLWKIPLQGYGWMEHDTGISLSR